MQPNNPGNLYILGDAAQVRVRDVLPTAKMSINVTSRLPVQSPAARLLASSRLAFCQATLPPGLVL